MNMDQERFNKTLEIAGKDDELKLKVLYNAVVKCLQDYNVESTAARLRDWQAAERALGELLDEVEKKQRDNNQDPDQEKWFDNVDEVIDYLAASGYVAKKSTVYRHRKQGKFLPQDSGQFRQKDVDRYARTWLKRQSTGRKVKDRLDELQEKKLLEEYEEQKEKTRKIKRQNDVEEGKLIDRADVEKWLAGRAGILEAGLKHWIQSRAADWVRMTGGDLKGVGELINAMIRDLDEHINGYAAAKEFDLVIEGGEEDEEDDGK